jgi:hypothetical protein
MRRQFWSLSQHSRVGDPTPCTASSYLNFSKCCFFTLVIVEILTLFFLNLRNTITKLNVIYVILKHPYTASSYLNLSRCCFHTLVIVEIRTLIIVEKPYPILVSCSWALWVVKGNTRHCYKLFSLPNFTC